MHTRTITPRATRILIGILIAFAIVAAGLWGWTPSAHADAAFRVAFTGVGIYPRSAPSMEAGKVGPALADGAWVSVTCETTGTTVRSAAGSSRIWERLGNGTYIPNVFLETGTDGWTPGVPRCDAPSAIVDQGQGYDRAAAAAYAKQMYQQLNVPIIAKCTYFASAVLEAGGMPTSSAWTPESTTLSKQASKALFMLNGGVGPTKRWASADHLKNYLVKEKNFGTITEVPFTVANPGVQLGDLLLYDWGDEPDHGVIDHIAVVTGFAPDGTALVTQKELDQLDRPWNWSTATNRNIGDSNPGTRAYVVHIIY
jgi:hypothetical protein